MPVKKKAKKKSISKKVSVKNGPNVTIYTTKTCPYCHMAMEFFKQNNVKYKEVDVSSNYTAAKKMIKKSGQMGVPVIEVNGKIIVGFDKSAINNALKK